jgi:hypothetical protein
MPSGVLSKSLAVILIVMALLCLPPTRGYSHPQSDEDVYRSQLAHALDAMHNPQAANSRVIAMWTELVRYSHHAFPVYPSQQFTAGHATLEGVYLDLSIAADPSPEVTRFFLAHEWGHMMHSDPLNQLRPIGQYQMLEGAKAAEDNADVYAATFMRYRNHDIEPVIDFFCALPDEGASDVHRAGPARAKFVAKIYGAPDRNIDVPCLEPDPGPLGDTSKLKHEIRTMAEASKNKFIAVRGPDLGNGVHASSVTVTGWGDPKCEFTVDEDSVGNCAYVLYVSDQSQVDAQYAGLIETIDSVLTGWTPTDETHDTSAYPTLPRREHSWIFKVGTGPVVQLELRKSTTSGNEFLVLTFNPS